MQWSTVLALVNYWRMKREDIVSDVQKYQSSVRTRKLLVMALINIPLAVFGVWDQINSVLVSEWDTPTPLAENIASLQIVLVKARSDLDAESNNQAANTMSNAIFTPLLAFYIFAWFGFGGEARKAYGEALWKLGCLISATLRAHWPHMSTLSFSWSATATVCAKFRRGLADTLPFVLPNTPQITPYISAVPPDDDPQVPVSPVRIQSSNPVGNRIDVKRRGRVPSREPARRLSIHKPLAALDPAIAISSVPNVPLRRLSHHKPCFVPLVPPNAPAIATPGASGSTPPRQEAANNIRRQEEFAPRPRPRRLSYHKPVFVPSAPANANSAVLNSLGPTISLVEIPMDIIAERNAGLQAESVLEDSVAPPPLSGVSSSTAPPPFSSPSTATAAPPYQDVDPLVNRCSLMYS